MNRRNFISSLSLAFSPMIFAPKMVIPTWKDTLKYSRSVQEIGPFEFQQSARENFQKLIQDIQKQIQQMNHDFLLKRAIQVCNYD